MQKDTPKPQPTPVSDDHPFVRILKRHKEIEAGVKARFDEPAGKDHPLVQMLEEKKAIEASVKAGGSVAQGIENARRARTV